MLLWISYSVFLEVEEQMLVYVMLSVSLCYIDIENKKYRQHNFYSMYCQQLVLRRQHVSTGLGHIHAFCSPESGPG